MIRSREKSERVLTIKIEGETMIIFFLILVTICIAIFACILICNRNKKIDTIQITRPDDQNQEFEEFKLPKKLIPVSSAPDE